MKYAVKITAHFTGLGTMEYYAGLRGGVKRNLSKIKGWCNQETAERWIESHRAFDNAYGFAEKEYEIITI